MQVMSLHLKLLFGSLLFPLCAWAAAPPVVDQQTIIFIRHGEKPAQGLGMLDCQGLNRALALPAVLRAKFAAPSFVFAADPHDQKVDGDRAYNYLRPVLTVAPTAIQLGLPINSTFGYADIAGLQAELALPAYRNAVVLVAWEHKQLEAMVKAMLARMGGSAHVVPSWKGSDFDSIYVLTVRRNGDQATASFALDHEGLNGQNLNCASPAPKP